jgi:MFS family permease
MLKNIWLLSGLQALMMSGNTLLITTSALVGYELATDKSMATLPLALQFMATMLVTIPASLLMKRIGRRGGFSLGAVLGLGGAVLLSLAVLGHEFWLFVAGAMLIGSFNGFGVYYRFAAVDVATEDYKSRAVSYVMAGGVIAALVGPNLANWTRDWSEVPFAGSFMALMGIYGLTLLGLSFLKVPHHHEEELQGEPRPLWEIMKQPVFIVALLGAMLGYGIMSFVMTATPLSMKHDMHPFADTAFVIQWHVLGMYAPSFITGQLIHRFGVLRVMMAGVVLNLACVLTNLSGTDFWHYWLALFMLGVGWNFLFVGATTLLTESYRPEEKAKVQAINDFLVFTTVTLASASAGVLQYRYGWQTVNLGVLPLLLVIFAAITWLMWRRRE